MKNLLFVSILALTLTSCGSSDGLTAADAEFTVPVGDNVTIRVDSNPSTGYSWKLVSAPPETVLEMVGERFNESGGTGDGSGGVQIYNFRAVGVGSGVIEIAEVDDAGVESRSRSHAVTVTEG